MNGPVPAARQLAVAALPLELEALIPAPLLLPGESLEAYHALQQAVFADIAPRSALEWLLTIDIAELSWEIRRYRLLRHALLEDHRQQAIEAALRRIDLVGIAPEFKEDASRHTRQNALSWRSDHSAASEIEARLASYGYDQHALNWEVFAQARDIFLMFEGLLIGAQKRRTYLLKEIDSRRNAR
ncbi:hypothetical protein ABIF38_007529 [Bradyrhizobium japonicum]|uniref:hypothetical protein n=1 Tax=Bradyrhizobium elkanii TaxID=29448 RepID=UPI00038205DA|nr:hypothetical protein [Bradyrhizobium elkanii]MCP1730157.1 hypothetical protein [Bradyrhizobium elkanii]MCS3574286.1 hypothetical protein [Bradyrhizobium elkanii]MCS3593023.1 hypothetical protein [Bradyrhizobium elkanii]MCS3622468.1 hypothetical protein [Bradyrhizobium elkanii]MCW2109066.1 hypothetical protein [Bradyrhizobium elkanii]